MLEKLKPRMNIDQLLEYGTDLEFKEHFKETLAYNHFTSEDQAKLKGLVPLLESNINEIVQIFESYLQELKAEGVAAVSRSSIERYIHTFFMKKEIQTMWIRSFPFSRNSEPTVTQ